MTQYVLYNYDEGVLATTNVYEKYRDAASDADDLKGAGDSVMVLPLDVPDNDANTAEDDEADSDDAPGGPWAPTFPKPGE